MGGASIMSKFLYTLSIILVLAKIFGLITCSWGICLLPAIVVIVTKCLIYWKIIDVTVNVVREEINKIDDEK